MDARAREVVNIGNKLFGDKSVVDSLWQEIAMNFYPERADFTTERNQGEEYANHLFSSYPLLVRRELGNLFSSNLRPQSQKWFSIHVDDEELDEQNEERRFLEFLTDIQWRATYERSAQFVKATKQCDHDFAAFGNGVIHAGLNIAGDGLLFKNYHLRDCAWSENAEGAVDNLHRNWKPTARQLKSLFPGRISSEVQRMCEKEPEKRVPCRHVVMPTWLYEYKSPNGRDFPYVSLFVETESQTVLEEVGKSYFPYVVPRWQTVSGSAYGRSMATAIGLPDGRTLQVVTRTLREAGEKYVDPPLIAIADAIRGDIPTYAGGITIADMEYDEKLGEVLRPLTQDRGGFPIGLEIAQALNADLDKAFFSDVIRFPDPQTRDMTAFEFRHRIEEQIRNASPVFEPVEKEYNGPLNELVFDILNENGAFPMDAMPETLQGREIRFTFRSPLSDMANQSEAAVFREGMELLAPIAEIDPAQLSNVDMTKSVRDALKAIGFKADWFAPEESVDAARQQIQQQREQEAALEQARQTGEVVEQGGRAAQSVEEFI